MPRCLRGDAGSTPARTANNFHSGTEMREDMFKVIVERPRRGAGWSGERAPDALDEDARAHESIVHRHRQRKSLNENLNPLRRWLERQVDRPWDKVYSELCA